MHKGMGFFYLFVLWSSLLACSVSTSNAQNGEMQFIFNPPPKIIKLLVGPSWEIYADGPIDANAAIRFEQMVKQKKIPRFSVVYLNSPGGSLLAGIELGKVFRKYRFNTNLGRFDPKPGSSTPALSNWPLPLYDARCMSACTFAYIGGEFRFMSKGGVFGVHRFYSNTQTHKSEDLAQILSGHIVNYLSKSGIEPDFFIEMTKAGSNEISILTHKQLEKMGVVNNGFEKVKWSLEALPNESGILYLKGVRNTQYGINKFMVFCIPDRGLELYIIFDPQGREEEVLTMGAQSIIIDGKTIPFNPYSLDSPNITNGWLNASYQLPEHVANRISVAKTVGFAFQYSRAGAAMLGFQEMEFEGGRQLFAGLRTNCK